MDEFNFTISNEHKNKRIDKFLAFKMQEFSRSYIQMLIENGHIKVNESSVTKNYKLNISDEIQCIIPPSENLETLPENIPLDIIYEDDDLLIINKPKDMVVHPAPGNYTKTLVNALLYHCKNSLSGINGVARPGIVHRIDKYTSGLLIVAKNDKSHKIIAKQIKEHSFKREYEAIVYGTLKNKSGTIRTNIGRHKTNRKKMAVLSAGGKNAVTHYEVIEEYENFTHIKLKLETGRTHQIRVHMAHIGNPVLGDEVYANSNRNPFSFLKGQCLHAKTIGFMHPTKNKYIEFTSPYPLYFQKILNSIKHQP